MSRAFTALGVIALLAILAIGGYAIRDQAEGSNPTVVPSATPYAARLTPTGAAGVIEREFRTSGLPGLPRALVDGDLLCERGDYQSNGRYWVVSCSGLRRAGTGYVSRTFKVSDETGAISQHY